MTEAPESDPAMPQGTDAPMSVRDWVATLSLCIVFAIIGAYWLKVATLPVLRVGLCESIPPIPSVAFLVFLLVLRKVLRHFGRKLDLSRRQIVAVYAFVSISVSIGFVNFYRDIPILLTAPHYAEGSRLQDIAEHVPSWLTPQGEEAIVEFWEDAPAGRVPWSSWLVPHHADCLRLADRSGLSPSRWMVIGAVAMLWGVLALFDWAPTQRYYIGFW